DCRMAKSSIGSAHGERDALMEIGQTLYVRFVDDGRSPAAARGALVSPCVHGIVNDTFRHHWRTVPPVHCEIAAMCAQTITEKRVRPDHGAVEAARVRIDQQVIGVETMPFFGSVGAMHAIAIELAGLHALKIAVPDLVGTQRQAEALRLMPTVVLEQAEIHGARMGRKQREIDATAVPGRAKRLGHAVVEMDHRGRSGGWHRCDSRPRANRERPKFILPRLSL